MAVGFVAYHYPHPHDFENFWARAEHAASVVSSTRGCLTAHCLMAGDGTAVVTVAVWDSAEAQDASLAAAAQSGVDFTFDQREIRPRTMIRFS